MIRPRGNYYAEANKLILKNIEYDAEEEWKINSKREKIYLVLHYAYIHNRKRSIHQKILKIYKNN